MSMVERQLELNSPDNSKGVVSLLIQRAVMGGRACTTAPSHGVDEGQCIFQKLQHCWGWGGGNT